MQTRTLGLGCRQLKIFLTCAVILSSGYVYAADPTADWRTRWEKNIISDAHNRYCDPPWYLALQSGAH